MFFTTPISHNFFFIKNNSNGLLQQFGLNKTEKKDGDDQSSQKKIPSSSELFSSVNVVADAARSTFNNQSDKVDKAKVANSAGDLLGAASRYGKLEEGKLGEYVEKAEDYLHNFGGSVKSTTTASVQTVTTTTTAAATKPDTEHSGGGGGGGSDSGSGVGDYFKMAQGFLKK